MNEIDNIRDKKLYKVHVDLSIKCQNTVRKVSLSQSILATSEQEAKNIARHTSITGISIGKVKEEFDFKDYIDKHNL